MVLAIGFAVTATLLSPYLLQLLLPLSGPDLRELSDLGQAYGAASALLAAFALIAVATSVALQVREARFARRAAERDHHFRLMQLMIEHPAIRQGRSQNQLYLNLMISYWEMLYEMGEMPKSALMEYARQEVFATEAGRRFWERTREHRMAAAKNRRHARFAAILDGVWEATPPPKGGAAAVGTAALVGLMMWVRRARSRRVS